MAIGCRAVPNENLARWQAIMPNFKWKDESRGSLQINRVGLLVSCTRFLGVFAVAVECFGRPRAQEYAAKPRRRIQVNLEFPYSVDPKYRIFNNCTQIFLVVHF